MSFDYSRLVRNVVSAVTRAAADELATPKRRRVTRATPRRRGHPPRSAPSSTPTHDRGREGGYAPSPDGRPDPGEVVWAWVPYEEDPTRGKDRPVLVLDIVGDTVHALQMTSQDHDRDAAQEARAGRHWMDVGAGAWDSRRRPSEVRVDRILRLPAEAVRREGAALDRAVFDAVVREVARHR